jgi:hypothetical protein
MTRMNSPKNSLLLYVNSMAFLVAVIRAIALRILLLPVPFSPKMKVHFQPSFAVVQCPTNHKPQPMAEGIKPSSVFPSPDEPPNRKVVVPLKKGNKKKAAETLPFFCFLQFQNFIPFDG